MKYSIQWVWLGTIGLVVLLLLWVNQSVRSTELSYKIRQVEEQIRQEQVRQTDLEIKNNRYFSLDYVEASAQKNGLVLAKENNVVVVHLTQKK